MATIEAWISLPLAISFISYREKCICILG